MTENRDDRIDYRLVPTSVGTCAFAARGERILRTWLPQADAEALRAVVLEAFPDARESKRALPPLARELREFFAGRRRAFDGAWSLSFEGITAFRAAVYRRLRRLPWGRTTTYGQLAAEIGRAGAARGVGAAMARNPFPPLVPCHRVLASDGGLGGFTATGGLDFKRRLLEIEAEKA